jgi:hypothetical protein
MNGSPWFWFACSVIFMVNGLFSAGRGDWLLAVLQSLTAVLAGVAALAENDRSRHAERVEGRSG